MKRLLKYLIIILIVLQGFIFVAYKMYFKNGYNLQSFIKSEYLINHTVTVHKNNREHFLGKDSKKADDKEDEITVESGECKGIKFAPQLIDETSWFPVDERKTMFVFSAFYIKGRKKVFIIGAKQMVSTITICQYWYQNESSGEMFVKEKQSTVSMPREGQNKKYTSTIFECGLGTSRMPSYISVVTKSCETPLNILRVKNVSKPEGYKNRFAVCLSPLYFNYSRAYELVEWIELNRILGAEKFVIYNISTSINVNQVLAYYSKRGLVEVMQWRLPMRVATYPRSKEPIEIHYFGQTAALNDCLFRSKGDSEYLVNVDLDEFIIPHGNNLFNWTDTIKPFAEKSNVFLFKSTYFRKEWENNITGLPDKDLIEKLKLVTLQIYEHEGRIFPARHRSKYIAHTASVDRILIHEVPAARTEVIPDNIGLVHHYRNWFNQKDRRGEVKDYTVQQKFGTNLIKRVQNVWNDLVGVKMEITSQ